MPIVELKRAYRFALDATVDQQAHLARHAGASRWAFNQALALKRTAHRAWIERRDVLVRELSGWSAEDLSSARHAKTDSDLRRQLVGYRNRAAAGIKPDLDALGIDARLWDHHRKSVFEWTSAVAQVRNANATPQQKQRAEAATAALSAGNPALARDLEQRRDAIRAAAGKDFAAARKAELGHVRAKLVDLKLDLIHQGAFTPAVFDVLAIWRAHRDRQHVAGGSPWHTEINVYAFSSGFENADSAWKNWQDSCSGKRKGRPVGYPRFKKKGVATDSFTLYHNVKKPSIRLEGYRAVHLPTLGRLRLHGTAKRLARLLDRGLADITSATLTRHGSRWYISLLAHVRQGVPVVWRHTAPDETTTDHLTPDAAYTGAAKGGTVHQVGRPTARQRTTGLLALDLGIQPLARLSAPLDPADPATVEITNPKYLARNTAALGRAQQTLSRCAKRSKKRKKAARRLARLQHQVATRRTSYLHGITKRLATGAATIAVEDLDVISLTTTGRGTVEKPGTHVKAKARFNRHLLDAGLGEMRRQLTYKTSWYGSVLVILDKGEATSTKCSECGERNPSSHPSDKRFTCGHCGHTVSRRDNAVRSIHRAAHRKLTDVAPGRGSTQKAPGGPVSPGPGDGTGGVR